jgi:hypothetical protein
MPFMEAEDRPPKGLPATFLYPFSPFLIVQFQQRAARKANLVGVGILLQDQYAAVVPQEDSAIGLIECGILEHLCQLSSDASVNTGIVKRDIDSIQFLGLWREEVADDRGEVELLSRGIECKGRLFRDLLECFYRLFNLLYLHPPLGICHAFRKRRRFYDKLLLCCTSKKNCKHWQKRNRQHRFEVHSPS